MYNKNILENYKNIIKYYLLQINYIPYINMSFNIVYPMAMTINADSFKDAIKKYAKLNYDMSIQSLIITDQYRYMKANLNYYNNAGKNKVAISLYPTTWPLNVDKNGKINTDLWPLTPQVTYDTKEYPATTYINGSSFIPRIVPLPLGPLVSPLPPVVSGIYPSVITY
jgi:hypothetical protein